MRRTSPTNCSGVRGFDHHQLTRLPEYRRLQQALDGFAHAMVEVEPKINQEQMLEIVTNIAAALGYSDMCHDHCKDDQIYHPYAVQLNDSAGLVARYRCQKGHTWTCWWSINQPHW